MEWQQEKEYKGLLEGGLSDWTRAEESQMLIKNITFPSISPSVSSYTLLSPLAGIGPVTSKWNCGAEQMAKND